MKYLSVCSGIEAVTVAWQPLGWTPVAFSEIDPFCCWLLRSRYGASRPLHMPTPNTTESRNEAKRRAAAIRNVIALPASGAVPNFGDFTQIGAIDVEPIDLLAGGTPCQSFSIAGKRAGLDDARGNLTLEFARLTDRLRPLWLVWENVPGVLSIDDGRTFGTFLGMLVELGYGVAYRILDASMRRPVYVKQHQAWFSLRWFCADQREARQKTSSAHAMVTVLQEMSVLSPRFHPHYCVSHSRLCASWGPRFSGCCNLSIGLIGCMHPALQTRPASRAQSPELGASSVKLLHVDVIAIYFLPELLPIGLFDSTGAALSISISSKFALMTTCNGPASRPQSPEPNIRSAENIDSCRSYLAILRSQRDINFSAHPKLMQQHRQFPGDCNHGPFLGVLPSVLGQTQSPPSQIAVHSKRTENELCALNHHRSQIRIAFLTDSQLWTGAPGVSALRAQANEGARIPAALEAVRISHCQDIGQRYQRPYSLYLGQQRCFGIALFRQPLNPAVVFLDALRQRFDLCEQRLQCKPKFRTQRCRQLFSHLVTTAFSHPFSIGLGNPPCSVDQLRARTYKNSPSTNHHEIRLCFLSAMSNGRQQLRVDSCQARQLLRIQTIIFTRALGNQSHTPRVGHDDFMPNLFQTSTYPGRMRPGLQRDPRMGHRSKRFLQALLSSRYAALQHCVPVFVQNTVTAVAIPQIKANGKLSSGLLALFQYLLHGATLLHGRSPSDYTSVCTSEWERTASRLETGLLIPSQHFGVPQRRRRVFVVGHLGDWRAAAAVLVDAACLSGHPPPRRETRQDLAPTLGARTQCGGGLGTDFDLDGGLVASTGTTAHCLNAGGMGRQDVETEALIAHALCADGFDASEDGTGRGTPMVPIAICTAHTQSNGHGFSDNIAHTLESTTSQAVAFNLRGREGGSIPEPSPMASIRAASGDSSNSYVAFSAKDYGADIGGIAPTLRGMGHDTSHANGGGQIAVASPLTASYGKQIDSSDTNSGPPNILHSEMAVRRLTPRECERLQGFPDDYTLVEYRGKSAADGPRYRALGNSMAVPVMRWIGERIAAVHEIVVHRNEAPPCQR